MTVFSFRGFDSRLGSTPPLAMILGALSQTVASHWGTCPPRLPTISFLVHFGVNMTANCLIIV